jgi:hypothetical protein
MVYRLSLVKHSEKILIPYELTIVRAGGIQVCIGTQQMVIIVSHQNIVPSNIPGIYPKQVSTQHYQELDYSSTGKGCESL